MPSIAVTEFGGINPSINIKLLKQSFAEVAINCDLRTRKLRPWPVPVLIGTVSDPFGNVDLGVDPLYPPNASFANQSVWADPECRDFVLENWEGNAADYYGTPDLPYANLPQGRVFYWRLNDNNLKFRRVGSAGESNAGVSTGPTCSALVVDGEGMAGGIPFATAYCATYVDNWGGEGAPGPPMLVNNYINGQRCSFLISDTNPNHTSGSVRVYRAISDFTSGEDVVNAMDTSWHLVTETPVGPGVFGFTFADAIQQHQISGDILISREFFPPPTGQIAALCKLDGGWLAVAFYDGRIAISQRHQWHAWPGRNIVQMPSNRVADAVAWNDTIMVTFFDRGPVWISVTADGIGIQTTIRDYREDEQAFSRSLFGSSERQSNRTLTRTAFGAAYWSQAGVVTVGPEGAQTIATKGLLLPSQIGTESLAPSIASSAAGPGFLPIKSVWHRGYYLTAMQWTAQRTIYSILDLPDDVSGGFDNAALTHLDFSSVVNTAGTGECIASNRDGVIILFGSAAYEWFGLDKGLGNGATAPDASTLMPYTYRSKVFVMPFETAFSAFKITAAGPIASDDSNYCRVKIWCNNRLVIDRSVSDTNTTITVRSKICRLPSSYRGTNWQFEITGKAPVDEFHLSTSYEDLIEQ